MRILFLTVRKMYRKKQKVKISCWFLLENHFRSIPNAQNSKKKLNFFYDSASVQFRLIGKGLLNQIVFYVPENLLTCPVSHNEETLFGYISIHKTTE